MDERRLGPPDRRPLPTDASKAIELLYARHEQLVDGHAELNSRLDDQAEELRANTQATQQAGRDAHAAAAAAARVETATARLVTMMVAADGAFTVLGWIADWAKRVAWFVAVPSAIYGGWKAFLLWLHS